MPSKFDPKKPFDNAQDKHHRRSIRLKGYDYSQPGAYYVTIVAWHRECMFGEVVNREMKLNKYGLVAKRDLIDLTMENVVVNRTGKFKVFHEMESALKWLKVSE